MSTNDHTRQRGSITREVTEKEIFEELQRINTVFNVVTSYFMHASPPADELQQMRRNHIINKAREMTLAAMSVRLRRSDPNIHRAVLLEGKRYAEENIQNKEVKFRITIPKKRPTFGRFLARVGIPVVFQAVLRRLKGRWKDTPKFVVLSGHYVDRTGRYTELQHRGNLRWQATVRYRTDAVMRVAFVFEKGAARFISRAGGVLQTNACPTLTESQARQWVLKLKTPTRITHAILAFYQRISPRQLTELMREVKKQPAA